MPHSEPDWQSLSEINFILYRRMSEHLNAALAAITLLGDAAALEDPEFWRERALAEVLRSLGLHNAWASLVRYRLGEQFLPQHMLQFKASEMLEWLVNELQLTNVPTLPADVLLFGNRDTLQEGLLLLHSCAGALGPGVTLEAQVEGSGMWFRVRYQTLRRPPADLDALLTMIDRMPDTWRARNIAFELARAREFLTMNNCELQYSAEDNVCELAFFVSAISMMEQDENRNVKIEFANDDTSISARPSAFTLTDFISTSDGRMAKLYPARPATPASKPD